MGRIGLMGGSFNPIHKGHLEIAMAAKTEYKLDEIWFLPSSDPPHKKILGHVELQDRIAMLKLAIKDKKNYIFSVIDCSRPGKIYTADTIEILMEKFPEDNFYFLIGGDSLRDFENWYKPDFILSHINLLVSYREDLRQEYLESKIRELKSKYVTKELNIIHCLPMAISSSRLRSMLALGRDVSPYVPKEVCDYINDHNLYRDLDV